MSSRVDIQGEAYARIEIGRVFYGWYFLKGVEVLVPMAAETHAELGTGSTVLLGLGSTNQQPIANLLMTGDPTPVWTPMSAAVPVGDRDAVKAVAAYQPWKAANVGIARIASQDSARTTFEIVETLAGSLPRSLLVNWPFEWGLPYPGVSADEYIISVDWFGGPGGVATMPDLRPNDSVNRALVGDALARWKDASAEQAAYRAQLERAAERANELGTAFLYNRAELVAEVEVRGRALRCCNAANHAIIANHVIEAWQGAPPDAPLITFGEGAVLNDACGDRFIYALGAPFPGQTVGAEQFSCANVPAQVEMPVRFSHYHRLPFSDASAARVKAWLASEAPLYQLHPEDRAPSPSLFREPNPTALWSSPLPPEVALASGPLVIVTVERATPHPTGYEVVLRTQLAGWRLEHLEEYALKLFFRCGDPRWREVGTTWLVPLGGIGTATSREHRAELIAAGKAFIVPGLMLPNRPEIHQAAQALRTYPDARLPP